jgi:hypothetical protein
MRFNFGAQMSDLTNPKIIKLKGILFLITGNLSSGLLMIHAPSWTNAFLLVIAVWSFCRFYYFAFYVIEHYVDPSFKFAGLWAFARYLVGARRK